MERPKIIPLVEELKDPLPPEKSFAALKGSGYSFFLDSSLVSEKLGRYSFLGCDPFLVFKSKFDRITLEHEDARIEAFKGNPFDALRSIIDRYRLEAVKGIPLASGGVGYLSYDLKRFVEELPDISMDDMELPDSIICFYDTVVTYDNITGRAYISSSGLPEEDPQRRPARARERMKVLKRKLASPPARDPDPYLSENAAELKSNFSKEAYIKAVLKAKEYIREGDMFKIEASLTLWGQLLFISNGRKYKGNRP